MPSLPSGYVRTNITKSVTSSASGQFRVINFKHPDGTCVAPSGTGGTDSADHATLQLGHWKLREFIPAGQVNAQIRASVVDVITGNPGVNHLLEIITTTLGGGLSNRFVTCDSSTFTVEETIGPYVLGVKFELIGTTAAPNFWKAYKLTYRWFRTTDTRLVMEITGPEGTYNEDFAIHTGAPADAGAEIAAYTVAGHRYDIFSTEGLPLLSLQASSIVIDGTALDTSEVDFYSANGRMRMQGAGSGAVDIKSISDSGGDHSQQVSINAAPAYSCTEDIDVTKFDLVTSSGATVVDGDGTARACPVNVARSRQPRSWANTQAAFATTRTYSMQEAWRAAQNPAPRSDDMAVALWGIAAQHDPTAFQSYYPVTLTHAATVDVHRPDGNTPSQWVSSDITKLTVVETATETTITVTATGATVKREFGAPGTDLPIWRRWLGIGTQGKLDALFSPDKSEWTKHTAGGATGQDVFGWESYPMVQFGMSASVVATPTLTIRNVKPDVDDTHVTSSQRNTDYTVTVPAAEAPGYGMALAAGANTVTVDTLLPSSGGTLGEPYFLGRVESLELSGLAVGTYVISAIDLLAVGSTYVKCDWGPPVQRQDYSALGWRNGGSAGAGALPDQLYKPDELGSPPSMGGNLRFVVISTGVTSGLILDSQLSLTDFLAQLHNCEGWTVTYSSTDFDAANEDADGVALGAELAQNLLPRVPYVTLTPGTGYQPPCNWVVKQIVICNGLNFKIYSRWPLGYGALETVGVLTDGSARAAGRAFNARRTDTLAVLASGVTDAHGYGVAVSPANGSLSVELVTA